MIPRRAGFAHQCLSFSATPVVGVALALIAMWALSGCGDERTAASPMAKTVGFQPEQFTDIPLPRAGYEYMPEQDLLAVAIAGGTVRRFEITMIRRENAPDQTPAELMKEYRRDLAELGWTLIEGDDRHQAWRKGSEILRLEAGRSGGLTTLQFRLRPAP